MIGKFKFRTHLVLAAAVLLASCSQDELMTDTGHDGLVPVTLSAAVGDGVQTRTVDADNDEDAKYCYVQVCQSDGTAYTDNDYATPIALTDDDNDGKFTGNIFLRPSETYVFLFWADNVTSTAPADLHNVKYQKESIAFADRVEQTISLNGPTVNATLQHVVAKVTLKTTTNVDASDEITVTMPTTYQAYNVNTEAPITAADNTPFVHTVTSDITGTEDGAEVFSFYALVDEANQNLTLANGTNSQPVSNVPLGPNKHTTLVGDVKNLGLTNVTFTAKIDTQWGSTETIREPEVGEGYTIDFNTHTITLSGANLNEEMVEKALDGTGILVINGESSNMLHAVVNNYDQITQLTLNDVTTIGDNTLNDLRGLTSLTLPKVTHLGSLSLGNSPNLKYLSLTAEEPITVAYYGLHQQAQQRKEQERASREEMRYFIELMGKPKPQPNMERMDWMPRMLHRFHSAQGRVPLQPEEYPDWANEASHNHL